VDRQIVTRGVFKGRHVVASSLLSHHSTGGGK
jgi:cytochrome c-type biogenesis protein CcmE